MSGLQTEWRFCKKCSVMFYNGFNSKGSCPSDGNQHAADGFDFHLPHDGPETDHAQRNWAFCRKCFAMHWSPAAIQVCNLGGRHDATGSLNFVLPHGTPETPKRPGWWRFCKKCSNMHWEPSGVQQCTLGAGTQPKVWCSPFLMPVCRPTAA